VSGGQRPLAMLVRWPPGRRPDISCERGTSPTPVPRASPGPGHGGHGGAVPGPHQSRAQAGLRRIAPPVPADPAPRAGGGRAAHDQPVGRRHLLRNRAPQRRLVHDPLPALLRGRSARPSGHLPARRGSGADPDVRGPGLRTTAERPVSTGLDPSPNANGQPGAADRRAPPGWAQASCSTDSTDSAWISGGTGSPLSTASARRMERLADQP
jgi:hypothetical protein